MSLSVTQTSTLRAVQTSIKASSVPASSSPSLSGCTMPSQPGADPLSPLCHCVNPFWVSSRASLPPQGMTSPTSQRYSAFKSVKSLGKSDIFSICSAESGHQGSSSLCSYSEHGIVRRVRLSARSFRRYCYCCLFGYMCIISTRTVTMETVDV